MPDLSETARQVLRPGSQVVPVGPGTCPCGSWAARQRHHGSRSDRARDNKPLALDRAMAFETPEEGTSGPNRL
jgi:hypothetical protein